ncbi:MAG: hypothetical protein WCK27_15065 [Verrucomicrobiota bacterium]
MTISAHFNGTVIVPDEPVALLIDAALELEVKRTNGFSPEVAAAMEAASDPADTAGRLAALREFFAHASRARTSLTKFCVVSTCTVTAGDECTGGYEHPGASQRLGPSTPVGV